MVSLLNITSSQMHMLIIKVSGLLVPVSAAKSDSNYMPAFHFRLTVLFDLVLYTDTLYFKLE